MEEEQEEYEVDSILSHYVEDGELFFEVKWKGYSSSTYEPLSGLQHLDILENYCAEHKISIDDYQGS
jgi:Chromo (CHRromatin Organisation MOdifier) domain